MSGKTADEAARGWKPRPSLIQRSRQRSPSGSFRSRSISCAIPGTGFAHSESSGLRRSSFSTGAELSATRVRTSCQPISSSISSTSARGMWPCTGRASATPSSCSSVSPRDSPPVPGQRKPSIGGVSPSTWRRALANSSMEFGNTSALAFPRVSGQPAHATRDPHRSSSDEGPAPLEPLPATEGIETAAGGMHETPGAAFSLSSTRGETVPPAAGELLRRAANSPSIRRSVG